MKNIDTSKPVLVTGANGYVASWIVKRLLEEGKIVHAAVRAPKNDKKVGHLTDIANSTLGTLKFFKADLLTEGAYKEAMQGCELVYHTASPFTLDIKDPQKELIDPAVKGTANVLQSVNEIPSVKRVVLTSSCAAIYTDAIDCQKSPTGMLTEEMWNTTASLDHQPYSLSKTLAEQKAWEMVEEQSRWDLVTINPPGVFGPPLNPTQTTSESMNILKILGSGQMRMGVPKMGFGVVDVREVAEAHLRAGYRPEANGRYIVSAHNTNFLEMGQVLLPKYGKDYPIPKRSLPKWLLMLAGTLANKAFTRKFVRNNLNIEWKADNSKSKRELGLTFRPLQETMEDGFQTFIDAGIFKK